MDLIERNLKIIKSLDKSSLYKNLYDNKIKIILCFLLIIIVSFSILYYLYQKYFINPMNYSSYLNLENIKTVSYKKPIKCAVLLTGNVAINTPATNTPKSVNGTGLSLNPGTYTINMRGRHVTVGTGNINSISIGLTTTADSFTGGTSGLPVYGFFTGQNNANILYNMTRVLTVTVAGSYFLTVSCSYGASQAPTITGTDFSAQIVRIA